jgi:small subunit ribosomal protein S20
MPQHKSAEKRVRQNARRRARNRLHRSRMRTILKRLRSEENKDQATALLNDAKAYLDRLASKGIIHKNKAANYKSELEKHVHGLS